MLDIHVLTLFPQMFPGNLNGGLIGKAFEKGLAKLYIHDLKKFSTRVDDQPLGGGAGMVIKCQVIDDTIRHLHLENTYKIFTSPRGYMFTQSVAKALLDIGTVLDDNAKARLDDSAKAMPDDNAKAMLDDDAKAMLDDDAKAMLDVIEVFKPKGLLFLCGRYEGVDQRVLDKWNFNEISIGRFVLCGGEVAAMVMIETIVRLIEGTVGNKESLVTDSYFEDNYLEHNQYTRPAIWQNRPVPCVLLEGNHSKIKAYRALESLLIAADKKGIK